MSHKRNSDSENSCFNDLFYTDRYFAENSQWYYYARGVAGSEPFIMGPFLTKEVAIKDCEDRFIKPNL